MSTGRDRRLRIERALALASGLLFALTLVWKDWIELVFHVDPDRGNGTLEVAVALAFLALTIAFGALARRERSKPRQRVGRV